MNASAVSNGNLYFQRSSVGDIFVANFQDRCYLTPERLPLPVNSEHDESAPFISPNESFLLFHSNRLGGFGGMDIYICFRKKSGQWTPPLNLGDPVNTSFNDGGPYLSPDRKYLFFSRFAVLGPLHPDFLEDIEYHSTQYNIDEHDFIHGIFIPETFLCKFFSQHD